MYVMISSLALLNISAMMTAYLSAMKPDFSKKAPSPQA